MRGGMLAYRFSMSFRHMLFLPSRLGIPGPGNSLAIALQLGGTGVPPRIQRMCVSPRLNGGPANGLRKAPPAVGCITLPREGAQPLWAAAARLEAALSEEHPLSAHSDGFLRLEVEVDGITDPVHWLGHQQRCHASIQRRDSFGLHVQKQD